MSVTDPVRLGCNWRLISTSSVFLCVKGNLSSKRWCFCDSSWRTLDYASTLLLIAWMRLVCPPLMSWSEARDNHISPCKAAAIGFDNWTWVGLSDHDQDRNLSCAECTRRCAFSEILRGGWHIWLETHSHICLAGSHSQRHCRLIGLDSPVMQSLAFKLQKWHLLWLHSPNILSSCKKRKTKKRGKKGRKGKKS